MMSKVTENDKMKSIFYISLCALLSSRKISRLDVDDEKMKVPTFRNQQTFKRSNKPRLKIKKGL